MTEANKPQLTADEQIFARRMIPHLLEGSTFKQAAQAVLDDDARLMNAALANDSHLAIQTHDGAKQCTTNAGTVGSDIRSRIAKQVYARLRQNQPDRKPD